MVAEKKTRDHSSESRTYRVMATSKPGLDEFYESVNDRMKNLAIARRPYKARNDKELSVRKGDVFEVLDDEGAWWCLRAPSGKAGHVPKYNLEIMENPTKPVSRSHDNRIEPIVVKVPVVIKTSLRREKLEDPAPSVAPQTAPLNPPEELIEKQPAPKPILKELIRRAPETVNQKETRYNKMNKSSHRRQASYSSTDSSESDIYENEPPQGYSRGGSRRKPSPYRRSRMNATHCCENHSCCNARNQQNYSNRQDEQQFRGQPGRIEPAQQQNEQPTTQLQPAQQQQPIIIILEPPNQEVEEPMPAEEYIDPYQQPNINIMLTPGQYAPQMTISQPYPVYGQMAQPMQWPTCY